MRPLGYGVSISKTDLGFCSIRTTFQELSWNSLVNHYVPSRSLRSTSQGLLTVPRSTTSTYGDRASSIAAPRLSNTQPLMIRNAQSVSAFKRLLKTYLFKLIYFQLVHRFYILSIVIGSQLFLYFIHCYQQSKTFFLFEGCNLGFNIFTL